MTNCFPDLIQHNKAFFQKALETAAEVTAETAVTDKIRLESLISDATRLILADWRDKVTNAATKGCVQTTLFTYVPDERFEVDGTYLTFMFNKHGRPDHRKPVWTIPVLNSVRGDHLTFLFNNNFPWKSLDIVPLMDRLQKAVAPATIVLTSGQHRPRRESVITIDWSVNAPEISKKRSICDLSETTLSKTRKSQ